MLKKGVALLYVKMDKDLYDLLKPDLLFNQILRSKLEEVGFNINPYDPCISNKMMHGAQLTVIWHFDDLKLSHVTTYENTKFVEWLHKIYGKELTVYQGKNHDYRGINLDWSYNGEVTVSMIPYLLKFCKISKK